MAFVLAFFMTLEHIIVWCSSLKKLFGHFKIVNVPRVRKKEKPNHTNKDATHSTKITQEIKCIVLFSFVYLRKLSSINIYLTVNVWWILLCLPFSTKAPIIKMSVFVHNLIKLEKVAGVSSHTNPEVTIFGLNIVFFQSDVDSTSSLFVK